MICEVQIVETRSDGVVWFKNGDGGVDVGVIKAMLPGIEVAQLCARGGRG